MRISYINRKPEVREEGQGTVVILLHGYPLDGDMWTPVSRILAKDFRVLRPDLPARRESPPPPEPTIRAYAEFLSRLVESVPTPVGIAGFSMGGYVLIQYLKARPQAVKAAAFIDTRAEADDENGRKKRDAAICAVREDGASIVARSMLPRLLSEEALQNEKLVAEVRDIILRQHPNTIETDLLAMREREDLTSLLPEISLPTLVLVGEKDAITPPALSQAMVKVLPKSMLVQIPGAGHLTPMEKPEAVAEALRGFFRETLR